MRIHAFSCFRLFKLREALSRSFVVRILLMYKENVLICIVFIICILISEVLSQRYIFSKWNRFISPDFFSLTRQWKPEKIEFLAPTPLIITFYFIFKLQFFAEEPISFFRKYFVISNFGIGL